MITRRGFLRHAAAVPAVCVGCGMRHGFAQPAAPAMRREVSVAGRRVLTVDVHAHAAVPSVVDVVKGTALEREARRQLEGYLGFPVHDARVADMNREGIDVQALSINAFWYGADRDLARRLFDLQAVKLAEMCRAIPGRFVGYAPVSLQFPELAAEELERGMKEFGMVGAAIGGNVEGVELGDARFDPFWKKAEELQALVFIHPQAAPASTGIGKRVQGPGAFRNVIGNPLETSFALAHLIFRGTLDRFPRLKICAAHGGGYLPSYAARMDHGCRVFPDECKGTTLKRAPSEYLKTLYFDSLVFTGEALRHLVAEHGASQIMIGTDYAVPWAKAPVDHVLTTPGLTDDERIAILGGNAAKLIKLPA
jgi:aminocarboxymuconate-semialdehyde decarboxylase